MVVEEIQKNVPEMIAMVRALLSDLESAELCDTKADFCENMRSAVVKSVLVKQELSKMVTAAEKCSRFAEKK